jgi:DNA repair/transcription protein MET18/MMS19
VLSVLENAGFRHLMSKPPILAGAAQNRVQAVATAGWQMKALAQRGHAGGKQVAMFLIDALGAADADEPAAEAAGEAFTLLLDDTAAGLTKSCHANLRLMYKQRIFLELLPKLVEAYKSGTPKGKVYILQALSHLLASVPRQVGSVRGGGG